MKVAEATERGHKERSVTSYVAFVTFVFASLVSPTAERVCYTNQSCFSGNHVSGFIRSNSF